MPRATFSVYALDPAMPVLLRPDGDVQIGWDPRRAVMIRPPHGLDPTELAALLRTLHSPTSIADLRRWAREHGPIADDDVAHLLDGLVGAGVATRAEPAPGGGRSASIRVHGRGPLTDLLLNALQCSGAVVSRSFRPHAAVSPDTVDLVVLTDFLVADPRILRDLHRHRVAHLPVRIRDGIGLVGPLVIPGTTSCLGCADRHRRDRDPAWPVIAAQLRDTIGIAAPATTLATAALALSQITRVIDAVHGRPGGADPGPPPALNASLEFDVAAGSLVTRHWTRHPLCPDCAP